MPSTHVDKGTHEIDALFLLLNEFCTNGQLRDMVRVYRTSDADFPLGNRPQLLSSLRTLVNRRIVSRKKIELLLERAEENGRQCIFLFAPRNDEVATRLSDRTAVEETLLEGATSSSLQLPHFLIEPHNIQVADFRVEERVGTAYSAWVFKLYSGTERWEQDGQPKVEGDRKTIVQIRRYRREVHVLKWHSFGLLEVRVPSPGSSLGYLLRTEKTLRQRLKPLIEHGDLVPLDVATAANQFNSERRAGAKWFDINSPEWLVDGHNIKVDPHGDEEDLYDSPLLATAVGGLDDCHRVRLLMHLNDSPDLPAKLKVELGFPSENGLKLPDQTTPEAVELVVREVWKRCRSEQLPASPVDQVVNIEGVTAQLQHVDFDTFARHNPEVAHVIRRIAEWVRDHPSVEFIDPKRLARALAPGIAFIDLAVAVGKLVEAGVLQMKYGVRPAHSRTLIPQFFSSFDDIASSTDLSDSRGELINMDDAEIVPLFGRANA